MSGPKLKFIGCGSKSCSEITALLDSGADLTVLTEESADEIGAFRLGQQRIMESVTGQQFPVELALMLIELGQSCKSITVVGVADKANLSGHSAIVGNDLMSQKCLEILFPGQIAGDVEVRCRC